MVSEKTNMKAQVSSLYKDGKQLPRGKQLVSCEGYLNLSVSKHPITGLCSNKACILSAYGGSLAPSGSAAENVKIEVPVTLSEFYNGCVKLVVFKR